MYLNYISFKSNIKLKLKLYRKLNESVFNVELYENFSLQYEQKVKFQLLVKVIKNYEWKDG